MPVLAEIRERFAKGKPLKGQRVAACLHVTSEALNLMRTLKEGGAEVNRPGFTGTSETLRNWVHCPGRLRRRVAY